VAGQVSDRILGLLRAGNLRAGDQLPPERDLALSLGVSRPSVREAMRGLQILGVVKTRHGGGAYISSLQAAELLAPLQLLITLEAQNLEALYDSRVLIDGEIGRRAAGRISNADLTRLRRSLTVQRSLMQRPEAFHLEDMAFHQTIFDACANPILGRIATSLYLLGMEYRRLAWKRPRVLRHSVADHAVILAALERHDADASAFAMAQHMRNVHRSTAALLKRGATEATGAGS
jgi:GntR family transcriptional regulator, transcriptional repressor for pyruvate dehydrogenase complex